MLPNGTPTLVPPTPDGGLIYTSPYEYPYALAPTSLLEYPIEHTGAVPGLSTLSDCPGTTLRCRVSALIRTRPWGYSSLARFCAHTIDRSLEPPTPPQPRRVLLLPLNGLQTISVSALCREREEEEELVVEGLRKDLEHCKVLQFLRFRDE
ncbi:hypothetical protein WMY93_016661 [Mugilogobius chulae]|uniref:Uncharacterized protein n=1 Tax=Mugilogobius chulae TaxID=88201 RepID=A0AAW0NY73_9GOBI